MSSYGYTNPFTVCFTSMKIRYSDYDSSIDSLNFISPDDKINVFISFESVLNNLSMVRDIENKLLLERNFPIILESETINLCAHYKKFFKGNGLDTRIFIYYTDLLSNSFNNYKYNDEYRSFYTNKYLNNPKFTLLGNKLIKNIIPRVKKIIEFIPDVHFISGNNIEGSLIPYIIAKEEPQYKNFIISTDKYDTQYLLNDDFCLHYVKKSSGGTNIIYKFDRYISELFKENLSGTDECELLRNTAFYSTLSSTLGDKMRSLEPLKGMGCKTLVKYITSGITGGLITKDTNTIDMISKVLPEELRTELVNNYNCVNIERQYNLLTQQEIFSITNQIVNRFDYNSLLELNGSIYKDYPLMLPELTC